MPSVLKPLAPHTQPVTNGAFRQEVADLCRTLMQPSFVIPPEAPAKLADALLSREMDRTQLVSACLCVLRSIENVVHILERAWEQDENALDALLTDGTLVAFLNTPLMQALLLTTPIPDLAMERLLTHVRQRLLDCALDPNWRFNTATLSTATALSVHAFLVEYVFTETDEEQLRVRPLRTRIENTATDALDPFDLAIVGCYYPLGGEEFGQRLKKAPWFQTDEALQMVARVQVDEPEREQSIRLSLPRITGIEDATSHLVQSLYEENPYPRWVSYIRNDPVSPLTILRKVCK